MNITTLAAIAAQLILVIFFGGRFFNRLENLEVRVKDLETEMSIVRNDTAAIKSIEVTVKAIQEEINRVRNRLDNFIDGGSKATDLLRPRRR